MQSFETLDDRIPIIPKTIKISTLTVFMKRINYDCDNIGNQQSHNQMEKHPHLNPIFHPKKKNENLNVSFKATSNTFQLSSVSFCAPRHSKSSIDLRSS